MRFFDDVIIINFLVVSLCLVLNRDNVGTCSALKSNISEVVFKNVSDQICCWKEENNSQKLGFLQGKSNRDYLFLYEKVTVQRFIDKKWKEISNSN